MRRKICFTVMVFSVVVLAARLVIASEQPAINGDAALALLKEGNARFVKMQLQHPNQSIEARENTAMQGQKPFAIVLACSDSRVPVELIFDRGIGDIFVIRVAGNIAMDSSVIGSAEYGVEHLHVPLLVVMGHTQCGAVDAAVTGAHVTGDIQDIQRKIMPVAAKVKKDHPELQGAALVNEVAKSNALATKKDLLSKSKEIRDLVAAGKLKTTACVYNVKSGTLEWLVEAPDARVTQEAVTGAR